MCYLRAQIRHRFLISQRIPNVNGISKFHRTLNLPMKARKSVCRVTKLAQIPSLQLTFTNQFTDVFQEPTQLPPPRDVDHHIPLAPNSKPINVRPYRFPLFQKNEIEHQVQGMIETGNIKPSTSPYSSPVLLVKKKKRWHMETMCGL